MLSHFGPNDLGSIVPIHRPSRSQIRTHPDFRDNELAVHLICSLVRGFFAGSNIAMTEIQL